jgi:prepilin-type N-terminal cleavage/methylation domain-containing protein
MKCYKEKAFGFTLLEILVVIVIVSLFFSTLIGSYFFIVKKSLKTMKGSRNLYNYAKAIYRLENAIKCSKNIKIDNSRNFSTLYLYTYCGIYKGFSKEVFFVKNNILYVYAYPYEFGDIFFYDEKKAIKLIPITNFRAEFVNNNVIKLNINNKHFVVPILIK